MSAADGSILVTGASGFVGQALVRHLEGQSRHVLAGVRKLSSSSEHFLNRFQYGSLEEMPPLADKLTGISTIVHCAGLAHVMRADAQASTRRFHAVNAAGTLHLAKEACKAGVKRFVYLSTIGVNGDQTSGIQFKPSDEPRPHSHYASSKLEAELALHKIADDSGLEVVVIRPPLIVGAGASGNVGSITKMIQKGIPLPFGLATKNRRTVASIESICSLVEVCLDHPYAVSRTFLAGDSKARSTRQIMELIGEYNGRTPIFLPLPVSILRVILLLTGKSKLARQLLGDLEVDISDAVNVLGWRPPR